MSFFRDLIEKGKDFARDQLGSEIVYERDQGIVSDTGNKPKIVNTAKDFLFPGRGFTDEEIAAAELNRTDTVKGVAKGAGEIIQGGATLVHMLGNTIADTVLPGFDADAARDSRNRTNQKVSEFLAPTNASQAKVMRGTDVLGLVPAGTVSKASRVDDIMDAINKTDGIAVDAGRTAADGRNILSVSADQLVNPQVGDEAAESIQFFEEQLRRNGADGIDPIEVRVSKDGAVEVVDGAKRLEAARNQGIDLVNVVKRQEQSVTPKATAPKAQDPVTTVTGSKTGTNFDVAKKSDGTTDVTQYVQQLTETRKTAQKSESGVTKRFGDFIKEIENKMVDFTAPIQRAVREGKKNDPEFAASTKFGDIDNNIDRVFNAPAITSAFIKDNGLSGVVQGLKNTELEEFDQYLIARHAQTLENNGVRTGRNLDADADLLREFGPKYQEAAAQIDNFVDARLDYMVESGLITRKNADGLREKYPTYVPFQRTFNEDELVDSFNRSGVASLSQQSVVQKIVGSNREIESPLESLLETTNKMILQGEKNKAAQTLTSYSDIKGNPFGLRQIKETKDAAPDKGTISVMVDGKKQIWEVNKDIADAAKALDVQRLNILGQIFAFPVRLARLGITGLSLPFVAKNVVRDQMSAFVMSDNGLKSSIANPRIWLAGLGEAINHGKLYDEMLSEGALMTSFDISRNAKPQTLKRLQAESNITRNAAFTISRPQEWLRAAEDLVSRTEQLTRSQQYLGAKQKALAEGATEAQARSVAARAARENSVNFARRGEWGTVMNSTWLYLNAGIQGSRLLIRNLKNKPVKTSAKIAATLMMPTAVATYWNLSDPERRKIYEDIPDYEKENNIIIIPPGAQKDENGRWEVFKIPLQPGIGEFAGMVRRPIEASQGLDEIQFAEAASSLLRTVQPVDLQNPGSTLVPQAIKPTVQSATNQNLFTGFPIVPESMQDLPNEQQVKDNTSGTAEGIANVLGTSPIKTEQFITDTTGTVGRQALNAADRIGVQAGLLEEDQVGGQSIREGIERGFTSAAGGASQNEEMNEIFEIKKQSRGEAATRKELAEELYSTFATMPKEEANAELRKIYDEDRPLYDKIISVKKDAELGLSQTERAIKQLGVADGTRAQYIYDKYLEIQSSSPDDARAYLKDLREKKVISDRVLEQIKELRSADTI